MYKLCVFVPESHLQAVKTALFKASAGKMGNYDQCCWQTQGKGQFRPLDNSQPFTGKTGKLEILNEYKIELVVDDTLIKEAISEMKQAHPYEEPAYDVWLLADI